jgi:hypothetical protein
MDEEALNLSIRNFLKMVGISSQREIEQAVARLREQGGGRDPVGPFPLTMRLHCERLGIDETFDGRIELERSRD